MRVLIIGGTGLISAALTRQLAARGESVTVFNRGQRDVVLPPGVQQLTGDRYNAPEFIQAMRDAMRAAGEFDCVVDMITFQPAEAAALVEAFANRTPHLILSSTIDVYQKPAPRYPYTENIPHAGIGAYPQGKAACEELLLSSGLPLTILRPAHTYGIGGHHRGHVVHSMGKGTFFLDRIRKGKPIIVHGDGTSLWSSCHLEDVAAGFAGAVGNHSTIGKTYHLTGDEAITWNRYHEIIAEAMNAPAPELVHIPTDILSRVAPNRARLTAENFGFNNIFDNTAAKRDLGFRQTITFLEGMRETIPWVERTYGFDSSDNDPLYDRLIEEWRRTTNELAERLAGLDN